MRKVNLISIHTIKPFDKDTINKIIQGEKPIFTIEEHSLIGGLGSIVSEYIAESYKNPVFKRFSLPDKYSHYVGSQKYVRGKLGLTSEKIIEDIENLI
jgi:transketolase